MPASRFAIPSPMTFLSLAPVASDSYAQHHSTAKLHRHNSTSSEASTSSEGGKSMRFLKLGHKDGDWSEEVIENFTSPMTFLSLAPVASDSYAQHHSTAREQPTEVQAFLLHRHNSTSSEASTSSEGGKSMRFLKLGHKDGDWSEEVFEN